MLRFTQFSTTRLNAYTLAAVAAGVGLVASAQPAPAEVIYTPTNENLRRNMLVNIDLNHDGITDFTLFNVFSNFGNRRSWLLLVYRDSNEVAGKSDNAAALTAGIPVGPAAEFQSNNVVHMARVYSSYGLIKSESGYWRDAHDRYLGLKFMISGQTHYGWARLNVEASKNGIRAALTGFAYETVPNRPIIAGHIDNSMAGGLRRFSSPTIDVTRESQPASLAMLARGSASLDIWRRRSCTSALAF
jgi:hypothetical protein